MKLSFFYMGTMGKGHKTGWPIKMNARKEGKRGEMQRIGKIATDMLRQTERK